MTKFTPKKVLWDQRLFWCYVRRTKRVIESGESQMNKGKKEKRGTGSQTERNVLSEKDRERERVRFIVKRVNENERGWIQTQIGVEQTEREEEQTGKEIEGTRRQTERELKYTKRQSERIEIEQREVEQTDRKKKK